MKIRADDFRVRGEKVILYVTLLAAGFVLLVLIGISAGIALVAIGISVAMVKIRQGQLLGTAVIVTDSQFPELNATANMAAECLSMPRPDLFVVQNPIINAYAMGFFGRKSVVLHSATVEAMSREELAFIIGHEFSHIKCAHTHWSVIAGPTGGVRIPVLSDIIGLVLLAWSRKAEYSSDRGGLIVNRDLDSAATSLAKVAVGRNLFKELNLQRLVDQKTDVDGDAVSKYSEAMATHPYIVNRVYALREFYSDPTYQNLTGN